MKYLFTMLMVLFAFPVYGQSRVSFDEATRQDIRQMANRIDRFLGSNVQPVTPSVSILDEKIEDCKIVIVTVKLLGEKSESEINPKLASLILRGLTRTCGFMNGKLRSEVMQAGLRGEITGDKEFEFYKIISAAELAGPRYQGILRRARSR